MDFELTKKFVMNEDEFNSNNIYTLPTANKKPIKVYLEGETNTVTYLPIADLETEVIKTVLQLVKKLEI